MEAIKSPSLDYISQKAQNVITHGHLKQDTRNMITFGIMVSVLIATHLLAYNSGIQTGTIITAHSVNIADAVMEQNSSNIRPGHLREHSEEVIRGIDLQLNH